MTQHEYLRLKGLLNTVASTQRTVANNMIEAEKRFALTEKALADLLKAIANRRRNR